MAGLIAFVRHSTNQVMIEIFSGMRGASIRSGQWKHSGLNWNLLQVSGECRRNMSPLSTALNASATALHEILSCGSVSVRLQSHCSR